LHQTRDDGRATRFWGETDKSTLNRFAEVDGTGYFVAVEHEGKLWVTCCDTQASAIFLAKIPISRRGGTVV
jgi:hypothetical protein